MVKTFVIVILGLLLGGLLGYSISYAISPQEQKQELVTFIKDSIYKKEKIGFLPYWLIAKANAEYSDLTTLTYFGLSISNDGTILKKTTPQEGEPGWVALDSGKVQGLLSNAKKNDQKLSLLVFSGNEATIAALMDDPIPHAKNFIEEITPIMKQYSFSDLNIDIESVILASESSQVRFAQFLHEVRKGIDRNRLGTLTVDVTADTFIQKRLIDPKKIIRDVDHLVIMAYDFHFQGSFVTGPVAPLFGVQNDAEFDINTAISLALEHIPKEKIILGIPLYGYEWETLRDTPRSATIPSSGLTASTKRVEDLLSSCASCSAKWDAVAAERYVIFKDDTGSYHQIFYPDSKSMEEKIAFAKKNELGGVALWALGYEDSSIISPLHNY